MTTQENERVVPGTISKMGAVAGKSGPEWEVAIKSQFFDSPKNYPVTIYIPKALGDGMEPGETHNFVLRSNGKVKEDYDGTKPWMWRWRWVRMADEGEAPSQAPSPAPAAAPAPSGNGHGGGYQPEARETSIQRQVLFKEARLATEFLLNGTGCNEEDYDAMMKRRFSSFCQIWEEVTNDSDADTAAA